MATIRAKHYDDNEAALAADPIIGDMASDITCAVASGQEINTSDFAFMNGALREYQRRGGTLSQHIGGPAAAIRAVMLRTADDLDRLVAFYAEPREGHHMPESERADLTERAARIRRAAAETPEGTA